MDENQRKSFEKFREHLISNQISPELVQSLDKIYTLIKEDNITAYSDEVSTFDSLWKSLPITLQAKIRNDINEITTTNILELPPEK